MTLIEESGKSFEQLCWKSDAFRDDIRRTIAEVEAGIDAASPGAEDHRRHLRRIAITLDDVSTVKLIALALYNDEAGGLPLTMMANMLADIGTFQISDAAELVAAFDDDVAALDRKLRH